MKIILTAFISALVISACKAPPSVQKVIDEKVAEDAEQNAITLTDPLLSIAQRTGRELYTRELIGQWAPEGSCGQEAVVWNFTEEDFARPLEQPCPVAIVEELKNGNYAIAGYCPRLTTMDEAEVVVFSRAERGKIIVQGAKGGPLIKC